VAEGQTSFLVGTTIPAPIWASASCGSGTMKRSRLTPCVPAHLHPTWKSSPKCPRNAHQPTMTASAQGPYRSRSSRLLARSRRASFPEYNFEPGTTRSSDLISHRSKADAVLGRQAVSESDRSVNSSPSPADSSPTARRCRSAPTRGCWRRPEAARPRISSGANAATATWCRAGRGRDQLYRSINARRRRRDPQRATLKDAPRCTIFRAGAVDAALRLNLSFSAPGLSHSVRTDYA